MSDINFDNGMVDGDGDGSAFPASPWDNQDNMPPQTDALGYATDNPLAGLAGVTNDRRENNPVRRSRPAGR
jgi:hypothetical protein